MAATYYWFPKMSGRFLSEKLGRLHFWSMVIGFNGTFFVQHFLGIMGMPRRVFTYPDLPGWGALNLLSTLGAFVMAGSVLVFLYNIARSLRTGAPAGDNPWEGSTLEWATTSPPHPHNFEQVPPVRGRRPLWDLARANGATRAPLAPTMAPPLDKNKIALWCLIASESAFFVILIFAYVFYNLTHERGPTAAGVLDPSRAGAFTLCLLSSSVTLTIAERRLAKGNHASSAAWLLATVFLGFVFLVGQGGEYLELWRGGVTINRNIFATTFFTLTGFHGLHVAVGLIVLATFTILVARGDYKKKPSTALVAAGLYWHFVDVVWVVVFSIVYLRQG